MTKHFFLSQTCMCSEVGPSLRQGEGSVFPCRRYVCCTVVSVMTATCLQALTSTVILGSKSHWTHDLILRSDSFGSLPDCSFAVHSWLVGQSNCCWPSPAQSFLASSLIKIYEQDFCSLLRHVCVLKVGPPLGWGEGLIFLCITQSDWPLHCCWPSPAQWFLVPSPMRLMTVFHSVGLLGCDCM
jgi:hypothetical protein